MTAFSLNTIVATKNTSLFVVSVLVSVIVVVVVVVVEVVVVDSSVQHGGMEPFRENKREFPPKKIEMLKECHLACTTLVRP